MPCAAVLLVNEDRSFVDVAGDALRAQGMAVLLVPGFGEALGALRCGFRPDVILVDAARGVERLRDFLRALLDEPAWRKLPVLEAPDPWDSPPCLVQIAPGDRPRRYPAPSGPREMRELLAAVAAAGCEPSLTPV